MSFHRPSRARRAALNAAISLALFSGSAKAQDTPAPEPFPAYRDGHLVPSDEGDVHHAATELVADVAQAAHLWCASQSTYPGCVLKGHSEREISGTAGKQSAYSKLDITLELTNKWDEISERVIDGGIDLVRSCPVDAMMVTDTGGYLVNRDLVSAQRAVACLSPDALPKPDALGIPEESGANQCPIGNSPLVGNPINPLTMSKIEHVVDYAGPTSSGLSFARHYHSGAFSLSSASAKASARYPAGARIGARWRHTYDRAFVRRPYYDANGNAYTTALYLLHEDGRETRFVKQGQTFVPIEGERGTLREHPEGGWVYGLPDLTEERYDDQGRLRTRTDANGNTLTLHYDEITVGIGVRVTVLERVTDRQGRELRLGYDRLGRVETVDTPDGRLNYSYSGDLLEGLDADLVSVGYPDGTRIGYLYDEPGMGGTPNHKLTGIVGKDGRRFATFSYDRDNRAWRSSHGADLEWTEVSQYDGDILVENKDMSFPDVWSPVYDHGRIRLGERAEYGSAAARTFDYLSGGLVSRQTDYLGIPTTYRYDRTRRLELERTEAEGTPLARTVKTTWHAVFDKPTRIDNGTQWTILEYDGKGNLIERRDGGLADAGRPESGSWPEERITRYAYDEGGLLLTVDGPLAGADDTTRYAYHDHDAPGCAASTICAWRRGDLHTVTNALGHANTVLAYDAAGRVLSSTDANGIRTDRRYDSMGQPVEIVIRARRDGAPSAGDSIIRLTYNANGDLDTLIDPDGATLTHRYDAARRLAEQIDALGYRRKITSNGLGHMSEESFVRPDGTEDSLRQYEYDYRGMLRSVKYPGLGGRNFEYDENRRLVRMEDQISLFLGYKEVHERDERGRTRRIEHGYREAGLGVQTHLTYDGADRIKTIVDPKRLSTSYLRNGLGDLLWQKSPDTGETHIENDSNGQPVHEAPADGRTVERTYDRLGRPATVAYRDGQTTTYTYDTASPSCGAEERFAIGRLSSVDEASGSTTLCYDFAGRIVRKIQVAHGVSLELRYTYSPAGRLMTTTYPDGRQARYVRDATGRITGVDVQSPAGTQPVLTGVAHNAMGQVTGWTAGSRRVERVHDPMGNMVTLRDARHDGLYAEFTYYGFGTLHNLKADREAGDGTDLIDTASRVTTGGPYGYDPARPPTPGFVDRYEYDATGNRERWWSIYPSLIDRRYTYASDSHHLLLAHGVSREYDAAGNTTRIGEREFVYDATGRMRQAKVNGVVEMNYAYNTFGQQVAKYIAGETTVSLHDEAGHWLGDYDGAGRPIRQMVWLDDLPVAALDGDAIRDIQPDHLGTPRVVIDRASDKAIWHWRLGGEAFGATAPNEDRDNDGMKYVFDMRFPGQRYDAVTKLFQNGWRDYDPTSGRYIQSDPIGLAGGISTYAYVANNPYMRVDPRGLDDSMCMFNPSACGWQKAPKDVNGSIGFGGWGNLLAGYGSGEIGFAFDNTPNGCFYRQICGGLIAGLPVQGELGVSLGTGEGALSTGTSISTGVSVVGGAGVIYGGQILKGPDGLSVSKGLIGIGGSPEGCAGGVAALKCETQYQCIR